DRGRERDPAVGDGRDRRCPGGRRVAPRAPRAPRRGSGERIRRVVRGCQIPEGCASRSRHADEIVVKATGSGVAPGRTSARRASASSKRPRSGVGRSRGGDVSSGKKFVAMSLLTFIVIIVLGAIWGHHAPADPVGQNFTGLANYPNATT